MRPSVPAGGAGGTNNPPQSWPSRREGTTSIGESQRVGASPPVHLARVGPTFMRSHLSRSERGERGTSQTSIRHHPLSRGAMRVNAVAPIHTNGVAVRHVGPRGATWVPPSIPTWGRSDRPVLSSPEPRSGGQGRLFLPGGPPP